jgi:hypothetical protein
LYCSMWNETDTNRGGRMVDAAAILGYSDWVKM